MDIKEKLSVLDSTMQYYRRIISSYEKRIGVAGIDLLHNNDPEPVGDILPGVLGNILQRVKDNTEVDQCKDG